MVQVPLQLRLLSELWSWHHELMLQAVGLGLLPVCLRSFSLQENASQEEFNLEVAQNSSCTTGPVFGDMVTTLIWPWA